MIKGYLRVIRNSTLQLILPGSDVTIKQDGTLWYKGFPLLGIVDPQEKVKASNTAKEKKWEDIPDSYYVRLGNNSNGIWAGDEDLWNASEIKLVLKKNAEELLAKEEKKVSISLSSRGWGDFDSVKWIGDITIPDNEIIKECREALLKESDVDNANQSDEEILKKIMDARAKWLMPKEVAKQPEHGFGYCLSCESYCFGDCGNYKPAKTSR
jgi:hypothetical protein